MSAKKRTTKFVAPKPESKHAPSSSSSSSSSDSDDDSSNDDDFAFYQSHFPLPTSAPKSARRPPPAASPAAQPPNAYQADAWTEVHDTRKEKYQQRRTARDAELASLQAEAEDNRRNEFGSLPRFVPYVRDQAGKWLGGRSQHKAKPKQLGVIEEYIIPDLHDGRGKGGKKAKKSGKEDLLISGSSGSSGGSSKEWGSEEEMAETIAAWIERQVGEEAMTVAQIGERIQARVGDSWNKRYKPRHGPLLDWLRSTHRFDVAADRVTVRPPPTPPHSDSDTHADRQQQQQQQRDRQRQQQRQREEAGGRRDVVRRAERSWLAFLLYVLALAAVGYGAYSVWSGRSMSDLAKQLSQQLEAMEQQVAEVKYAAEHSGSK